MMRAVLLAGAALWAFPAMAQDHSGHEGHAPAATAKPMAMDHCAMGHLPPEQCPPKEAAPAEAARPAATDHSQMDQGGMDHDAMGHGPSASAASPPARATEGPRHAADAIWGRAAMAPSRDAIRRENGGMTTGTFMLERLEARITDGEEAYLWDAQAWYGGDIDKFWLKTEGEGEFGGAVEDAEMQALWSHAITPFFDLQAGARLDVEPETRSHLVLGVQGLAPYMWHVDAAAFLSDRGDLTARLEAEYDQKITQRLILQPRAEFELAAQDIAERAIGSGVTKAELGLRLRYEIVREFAPYVGVEYEAKTGRTADIARAAGQDPDGVKFLMGVRAWF